MERIEKLKAYLQETPHDEFLQHALALEWIKLGNEADAKRLFENILSKNPLYVGSYYHLAKLLERLGNFDEAKQIYRLGIEACRKVNDRHALNELQMALEEIEDE